jgi:hypothetical protein
MKNDRYDNMLEALAVAQKNGFIHDFHYEQNVLVTEDNSRFVAEEITIVEYHRFEGASNPDDEAVLYLIKTSNGLYGTLSDAYGVNADPELAAFMERIHLDEKKK